jgi:hypothetical protein
LGALRLFHPSGYTATALLYHGNEALVVNVASAWNEKNSREHGANQKLGFTFSRLGCEQFFLFKSSVELIRSSYDAQRNGHEQLHT